MIRAVRWLLLEGPCRMYVKGEETGGALPISYLLAICLSAVAGGTAGFLAALARGGSVASWAGSGALAGLLAFTLWALYSMIVIAVLWVAGRSPADILVMDSEAMSSGRHAKDSVGGWRRAGDPLIPPSLVGILLLMAVFFGFEAWSGQRTVARYEGRLVTREATVLRFDDGLWGFGDRKVIVKLQYGSTESTVTVRAEDFEDPVPRPGRQTMVEFPDGRPSMARPAGSAEVDRSDLAFWRGSALTTGGLALLSAAGFLWGRRGPNKHRSGGS